MCDVAINIDCIRASMKNNTKYSLILLLSTISDEISRIDADVLSANKTPIGAEILYSQDIFLSEFINSIHYIIKWLKIGLNVLKSHLFCSRY